MIRIFFSLILLFVMSLTLPGEGKNTYNGFDQFEGYNHFYYQILDKNRNVILRGEGNFEKDKVYKPARTPLATPVKFKGNSSEGKVFFSCGEPGENSSLDFLIYTGSLKNHPAVFRFSVKDSEVSTAVFDSKIRHKSKAKFEKVKRLALKIEASDIKVFKSQNNLIENLAISDEQQYYFSMIMLYSPKAKEPNIFYDSLKKQGEDYFKNPNGS